jgi:hypothetical protein
MKEKKMNRQQLLAVLVIVMIGLCTVTPPSIEAAVRPRALFTVKATPEAGLRSQVEMKNFSAVEKSIRLAPRRTMQEMPVSDVYLTLDQGGKQVTYLLDSGGNLYDGTSRQMLEIDRKMKIILKSYAERLRTDHYGQILHWKQAGTLIADKSILKVTDLETGLTFEVQKRAGRNHADVQPLTKADTAVMKKIYNGKWSWNRKAVLVEYNGKRFAASMNGMPHGGDGIPGNNFSGHFCIHFQGSMTHGRGKIDPMHQLMVYKAAGKLPDYLGGASPNELADTFFFAMNMGEREIMRMLFTHAGNEDLAYFLEELGRIASIDWRRSGGEIHEASDTLHLHVPYHVLVRYTDGRKSGETYDIHFQRITVVSPWRIESVEK